MLWQSIFYSYITEKKMAFKAMFLSQMALFYSTINILQFFDNLKYNKRIFGQKIFQKYTT
ncbi:hypothetical protein HW49_00965 [Porphyromonadaceae bacterium COT-184 OH4590]|nr:hypothetical protein HW49_00965 [Porphyromonadaceae bacterium COT-184 OH4590]